MLLESHLVCHIVKSIRKLRGHRSQSLNATHIQSQKE